MDTFVNQLPTLAGVIIGFVSTLITTAYIEKSRWRRDQASRWDSRRLEAYVAYSAAVKDMQAVSARITAPMRSGANTHSMDLEDGLRLLAEASLQRSKAWESMLLLGDESTVAAARVWWKAVRAVEMTARKLPDFDDQLWEDQIDAADLARDRFYAAARASLAVSGGSTAKLALE